MPKNVKKKIKGIISCFPGMITFFVKVKRLISLPKSLRFPLCSDELARDRHHKKGLRRQFSLSLSNKCEHFLHLIRQKRHSLHYNWSLLLIFNLEIYQLSTEISF